MFVESVFVGHLSDGFTSSNHHDVDLLGRKQRVAFQQEVLTAWHPCFVERYKPVPTVKQEHGGCRTFNLVPVNRNGVTTACWNLQHFCLGSKS
ncbi:MAG: hypothetical protein CVU24_00470 [Betaproteobacteria bacterium HGW-Betaproteobacteria-18]|nr:MAG: hypothetical protein CVU24_00470 [Betaproteobacteria bacterium HGW-Betaproteobacteria-18]